MGQESIKDYILNDSDWHLIDFFPDSLLTIKNNGGTSVSAWETRATDIVPTDEYLKTNGIDPIELGGVYFEYSTDETDSLIWVKAVSGNGSLSVRIRGTIDPSEDITQVSGALNNLQQIVTNHISAITGNVHQVTKTEIGLSNIPNAITDEVTINDHDVLATSIATSTLHTKIQVHEDKTGNVHSLVKADIELGNVENYPPADSNTAIDATNNTTYMTPKTTYMAVSDWIEMSMNMRAQTVVTCPIGSRTLGWSAMDCSSPPITIEKLNNTQYKVNKNVKVAFADLGKTRVSSLCSKEFTLTIPDASTTILYVYADIDPKGNIISYGQTTVQPFEGMERGIFTGDFWNVAENVMYDNGNHAIRRVYVGKVYTLNGTIANVISVPIGVEYTAPIYNEVALGKNYVYDSPFTGVWSSEAEVEYSSKWGPSCWNDQSGVTAHPYPLNKLDKYSLQCGQMGFLSSGKESGTPLGNSFPTVTTPLRVRVVFTKKY